MGARRGKRRGFTPLGPDEIAHVTLHGAAGEVTGSAFLVETRAGALLVDCGMVQGSRADEARNRRPFPFDPRGVDAVLLTHAHLDHSGLLPKLGRDGFRGAVHATTGTADLLPILLRDAAHVSAGEAARETRRLRRRRGGDAPPIEPVTRMEDVERVLERIEPKALDRAFEPLPGVEARFRRNGHILGAASLELVLSDEGGARTLVVSGDVGRFPEPMLLDPDPPPRADLLLCESTYGDRDHRPQDASIDELARVLDDALDAGENVIVPVFAVGRAQELLYQVARLERAGRLDARPVYLDSPMAIRVTELYRRHAGAYRPEVRQAGADGDDLEPKGLILCRTAEESIALNAKRGALILAASGMCEGGRVVHHLKHNLWRPRSHVVIVGFQARGTLGRALVDGAREVRIHGERIAVRASIHTINGFSAHGGQSELARFAQPMLESGAEVALVHGEPEKSAALARRFAASTRRPIRLPARGDRATLCARGEPVRWSGA